MAFSRMKVARSGLVNGLQLKLKGEGERTRLWCSEPDRLPPGKLSGLGYEGNIDYNPTETTWKKRMASSAAAARWLAATSMG